jgi:hypothetical protein
MPRMRPVCLGLPKLHSVGRSPYQTERDPTFILQQLLMSFLDGAKKEGAAH